jgi:uncharacterized protein DUF6801
MARRLRAFRLTALASGLTLVAGTVISASGVLADATPAGAQVVRAHLAYRCLFPAGPRPVNVTVAGTFPATAVAGQPIKPSQVRTTVAFPRSAVAGPGGLGGARVTGHNVLSASVAGNASAVTARWPGQLRKPVRIPATGTAHLAFPATVPPVTTRSDGTVTFSASGLTFDLRRAGEAAVNLASLHVTCTLRPGQHTTLATVPVIAAPTPVGTTSPGAKERHHAKGLPGSPAGTPPGCGKRFIHGGLKMPLLGCAYLIGYADVKKLNGAALIGPDVHGTVPAAQLNVDTYDSNLSKVNGTLHAFNCTAARLDYHGQLAFPPTRSTFLGFGFAPVSAVMQLTETKWPQEPVENPRCYQGLQGNRKPVHLTSPLISVFTDINTNVNKGEPILNTGTTYLSIHVSQVTVNGVPLPVGPDCGVGKPVRAVLVGRGILVPKARGYTVAGGGPLTGNVTIPSFTHCGVGENLNPLLTASISGPANFQLITQGTLCTPKQPTVPPNCPPNVPKPLRHVKPLK